MRLHPGETRAEGWRVVTVLDAVQQLVGGSPDITGRPLVIAIDGRGGADVVWVEGTGIIRDEIAPWLDASVWMQGDLDEQERLLAVRDGDSPEQAEHVANWLLEELPFMLRERPWCRADLIVGGPPPIDHDPATELVIAPPTAS